MRNFHHILYASMGLGSRYEGLKQALGIARDNQAALKFLLVYPELPKAQQAYRDTYLAFLHTQIQSALQVALAELAMDEGEVAVTVQLENSDIPPAISMIRHVLRDTHDLLVKDAEPTGGHKGFKGLDMTLLRKCPCPVWLARPVSHSRAGIRVAVAINPDSRDEQEQALSVRLLALSASLAASCGSQLAIVSCWDFEFEEYLRGSGWVSLPESSINDAVAGTQVEQRGLLQNLVNTAAITDYRIYHLRGRAEQRVPEFVDAHGIDIVVMGTLARTGIKGFLMGNTAENIIEELGCTVVALKPNGFVSPVEPY